MLVLTRRQGDKIRIGDDVVVCLVQLKGNQARIGIDAPADVVVDREEIFQDKRAGVPPRVVYTTGEAARICRCAPRTVAKWCDGGHLPYYRLPGSGDRRITRDALAAFLEAQGMPLDGIDSPAKESEVDA